MLHVSAQAEANRRTLEADQMGLFTKPTVARLREDAAAFGESCSIYQSGKPDAKAISMLVTGPRGQQLLLDLFTDYQAAVADVGQEKALNEAIKAARAGANGAAAQDLAVRTLRTFLNVAQGDSSLSERFGRAMSSHDSDKDERELQEFFAALAHQFVRGRSGEPQGQERVTDMFTAREMFREIYDRVLARKGDEAARLVTVDHARMLTPIYAAIYGVRNQEGLAQDVDELVTSFLAEP